MCKKDECKSSKGKGRKREWRRRGGEGGEAYRARLCALDERKYLNERAAGGGGGGRGEERKKKEWRKDGENEMEGNTRTMEREGRVVEERIKEEEKREVVCIALCLGFQSLKTAWPFVFWPLE